jgi:phage terminase large subunit GpA-like protein
MQIDEIVSQCQSLWKPPEKLKLSEWADKYFRLSPESSADVGRWRCYPYQREILDALVDPSIEIVTWMKSARTGYTKMLDIDTAFHIAQEPCSQLIVQPTVEDAAGYSKDEIAPMLRDVPVLEGLVFEAKSRDSNNTILKKSYPGGILHLVGANSARGFRRITVKRVKFDEVDGYPPTAGHEGDQIKLGSMRSSTFWDRKIIIGSTPTIKGISRVEKSFLESDQRYRFLPCPYCGGFQVLKFRNIRWPKNEPEKAQYQCEFCEKLIPHSMKRQMDERGEWRATQPFKGHAGFHIWAGYSYSPNSTWADIAEEFLKVKADREQLKTFTNTVLGETWEEDGDQPEWEKLSARSEPYRILNIPYRGQLLVAGVDTQDNRLEVVIIAYGAGEESWVIYRATLYGDPDQPEVWRQLDEILGKAYPHESGADLHIEAMAVDTGGHKTQAVYNYCRARGPVAFAVKGQSQPGKPVYGRPTQQDVDYLGRVIKNGVQLYPVGSDVAKGVIYNRLRLTQHGPGFIHFPIGLDDDFYLQLTAEKNVKRFDLKGREVREWVKVRERNDVLDCFVYAYAAALKAGVQHRNWSERDDQIRSVANKTQVNVQQQKRRILNRGIQ